MADFDPCFEKVLGLEGGYKLHTVKGDRGGMTYAGISRVHHPTWPGWAMIDRGDFGASLSALVRDFFKEEYWDTIHGDIIGFQSVAYNLYVFGIKNGIKTSIRMCQKLIGAKVDGDFGPKTLRALTDFIQDQKDEKIFVLSFSLMKIFRDSGIAEHDSRRKDDVVGSNLKFLCGWINRTKAGLEHWGFGND
jgi:lysozyme family protein